MELRHIQHLHWRAGFGIQPKELAAKKGWTKEQLVDDLFKTSKNNKPLVIDLSELDVDKKGLSKEERKKLRRLGNQKTIELNILWMQKMVSTKAVLREKMTFFFHDHFATRLKNPLANVHLNNILREHALGNFGTLLREVSKSPAMILFLNNQQNKKGHPNENFAREVMELFTLGRDNGYTEQDIKEAARAFTGWSINKEGQFVFRKHNHDTESKAVLGRTGNFDGDDVLDILLEEKQTARYLTEKIVDFLIARPIGSKAIEGFTETFYSSGYNLETLLRSIFLSDIFYEEASIGCRIKSPTELLVGINRLIPIDFQEPKVILGVQRRLNQVLFSPPNVAGWPSGKGWIDSSTLMLRMKIPSLVLNEGVIEYNDEDELSEDMKSSIERIQQRTRERTAKRVKATPDWTSFMKSIKSQEERLQDFLLQAKPGVKMINMGSDIQDRVVQLMSLPEYQLC